MKKRVMLDGMRTGWVMKTGVDVSAEKAAVRNALLKCGAQKSDLELWVSVPGMGSKMRVCLRQDQRYRQRFYLNFSGNPVSFLYGSNVYGDPDPVWQILAACELAMDRIRKRSKTGLKVAVTRDNLILHSLEFAGYTSKIRDPQGLINAWDYMYRAASVRPSGATVKDRRILSLARELGVSRMYGDDLYDDSFALTVNRSGRAETRLMVYDKTEEVKSRGRELDAAVATDLKGRLRFDLQLVNWWFNRRRIKTLADLDKWCSGRQFKNWSEFVRAQLNEALSRTCLAYMWVFPNVFADPKLRAWDTWGDEKTQKKLRKLGIDPSVSREAHVAMLKARWELNVTSEADLALVSSCGDYSQQIELVKRTIDHESKNTLQADALFKLDGKVYAPA